MPRMVIILMLISPLIGAGEFDACKLNNFSNEKLECNFRSPITHNMSSTLSLISTASKNIVLSNIENEYNFKEALKKEVDFLFEAKIFEINLKKNCAAENYEAILSVNTDIDKEKVKEQCQKILQKTKSKIQNDYSPMRVSLALSEPKYKENRILRDTSTWYNSQPVHSLRQFASMPPLNAMEKNLAGIEYLKMLDQAGSAVGKPNLSQVILDKQVFNVSYEIGDKAYGILSELQKVRSQKKNEYVRFLFTTPELGYIKSDNPSNADLALAYNKIGSSLAEARKLFLKNVSDPNSENWNAHFKLKPLMESLLMKNPAWCSVAMKISKENEKKEKWDLIADISFSILAGLPCLAAGPLGAVACVGLGLEVGRVGIKNSEEAVDMTLGKSLLGQENANINELSDVERQAFLQKVFLPLSMWGGVAKGGGIVVEKIAVKKAENVTAFLTNTSAANKIAPVSKEVLTTKSSMKIKPSLNVVEEVSTKDPQIELWKLKEAGDIKKAKLAEEKIRKQMKNQKIKEIKKYSDSTEGARLVELEDGTKAIWKPIKDSQGMTEVASYEVDQVLGLNQVPLTVGKSFENKKGTLQIFVNNATDKGNNYSPAHFKMFDYLIGNVDRRGANYLVTNERRIVAIDNSMTFN
ncbi:MAG: hypothetical protein KDD45_06825, partial [Bdellovibrionales bacterium]|nr:hypothetical protein [Bdellovibrionales bacterium]